MNDVDVIENAEADAPALRFVDICPECGYSLKGLPDEGVCPECGKSYDQRVLILHGMGSRTGIYFLAFLTAVQTWVLWPTARDLERNILFFLAAVALLPVMLALALIERWSHNRPGLIQVFLSSQRCLQINSFPKPPGLIVAWSLIMCGLATVVWLKLFPVTRNASVFIQLLLAAMLAFAWVILLWRARKRIIESAIDAASATPWNLQLAKGTSWERITDVLMECHRDGRLRIRLRHNLEGSKLRFEAVDAEVRCDRERAAHVEALIRSWIRAAQRP